MNIVFSLDQLEEVAKQIIAQNPHKVILFHGEMGVGKTTLIKQLCKTLGISDATSSPTFSLINEYQTDDHQTVYHFDFYRLKNLQEAYDIGYEEYFYSGNYCLVEWPSKVEELLPEEHIKIEITVTGNEQRLFQFTKIKE